MSETDWRAELEAFGKGVAEDANEVQRHTQAAVREGATRLENLPQQAAKARFPPVDPTAVKTHIDQVRPLSALRAEQRTRTQATVGALD